jgi:hypothetical protein
MPELYFPSPANRMTVDEYLAWYEPLAGEFPDVRVELLAGRIYDEDHVPIIEADAAMDAQRLLSKNNPNVYVRGSVRVDNWSMWNPSVYALNRLLTERDTYPSAADVKVMVDVCDTPALVHVSRKVAIAGHMGVPEYWIVHPRAKTMYRFCYPEPMECGTVYTNVEYHPWPEVAGKR